LRTARSPPVPIASPEQSVELIRRKLPPAERAPRDGDPARWIADLDHDEFRRREEATEALRRLGPSAEAALCRALGAEPSAEKRRRLEELLEAVQAEAFRPERVRPTRALEVLERIGTAEAKAVLAELAKGDPEAPLTQEAKATRKRLEERNDADKP
jgi:hypothetical protein